MTHKASTVATAPLLTSRPWEVVGISRTRWFALRSADRAPAPVDLGGRRRLYRMADLLAWVDGMAAARRKATPAVAA